MSMATTLYVRSDGEDDEEEDEEEEVEYSGMIQPPLIHQLRNILTEYPDGGQILKELIQNAEDAGANVMQIFYDRRPIIPPEEVIKEKKTPFRTYFKGPSLCFYNDALFTEKDWMGIKMMYNSIKVFDPLKVGKFGLGFKSVFHITEFPIIISGKQLLVIDPNKDSSKVCQTIKLRTIHRGKSRKMAHVREDCIRAFVGLFGFSESSLESGFFKGSILRLPLRQTATELSDVVYNDVKARELLESFKEEAPVCLLFLKSLTRIEIINDHSLTIAEPSSETFCKDFEVYMGGTNAHEVVESRQEFVQRIKDNEENKSNMTIRNTYKVTLVTDNHNEVPKCCSWTVVNMYKGEGMSEEMKRLGSDKDLSYSPYVGAAFPLSRVPDFIGHVFCFLPLPLQNTSLTGLPIHVNGFLALSQNRRHIKWPTVDQVKHSTHQDKPIRWNECLVKEALSEVYAQLIQTLISNSKENSNPKDMVENVYKAIPDIEAVVDNWNAITEPFLNVLKETPFLFTENGGGKWIAIHDAIFLNSVKSGYQNCVKEVLEKYEQNWVDVPEHIWYICQHVMEDVCIVTPTYLSGVLKKTTKYKKCSGEVKIALLSFLIQGKNFSLLDGLNLLPVASGEFLQFNSSAEISIYLCSEKEKRLLPGLEDIILSDLPKTLQKAFVELVQKGIYQIKFPEKDMVTLLERTMKKNFGASDKPVQWNLNDARTGNKWLEHIWTHLRETSPDSLETFQNLPLIPISLNKMDTKSLSHLKRLIGMKTSSVTKAYALLPLSTNMMLQKHKRKTIPKPVQTCIEAMHITVIEEIPEYILRHLKIHNFVHDPGPECFLEILEFIREEDINERISSFHSSTTYEQRDSFIKFAGSTELFKPSAQKILRQLQLFPSNENERICVNTCDIILRDEFPVRFPETVLKCSSHQSDQMAINLGARVFRTEDAVERILESCSTRFYSDEEKHNFMKYFMTNISHFKENSHLMQLARQTQFVPTKSRIFQRPVDVYDPFEPLLTDLLLNDNLIPEKSFAKQNKGPLRKLGMKGQDDIRPKDILEIATGLNDSYLKGQVPSKDLNRRVNQSKALMKLLEVKIEEFNKFQIHTIQRLCFVIPSKRPNDYPANLPWKTEDSKSESFLRPVDILPWTVKNLVGSVAPLFDAEASHHLSCVLNDGALPSSESVVSQLEIISTKYEEKNRVHYLPLISDIFTYLAKHFSNGTLSEKFRNRKIMWNGNGFCHVQNMYCEESSDDIALEPYMYYLPPELKSSYVAKFCRNIGCYGYQDCELYLSIQRRIKNKYDGNKEFDRGEVRRDLDLFIKILNRLKKHTDLGDIDVLFPIHTKNNNWLDIRRAKDCTYCNSEWLKVEASEDGEMFNFIHADVPLDTAEKLGVPSLTDDLLMETEGIESWGQKEPLTRRLHNLLKEYKDGFAVPKEIVQNADDSGATQVCFLYDERENDDYRCRLIDENMSECQGPALWAYNNQEFTQKDLQNITKLSGATKENDSSTIGKFGLGFCSVYNLTDVPSFITGENIIIFDPHAKYLGKAVRKGNPGLKIDLSKKRNKVMLRRMKNQFQPFEGVFGCKISVSDETHFPGTLFRLPLRNQRQADNSEITDKVYDRSEMKEFIEIFKKNAGNLLLFTQNIETIEFYHLHRKATDPSKKTLLYRIHRDMIKNTMDETPLNCMNGLMKSRYLHTKVTPEIKSTQLMKLSITSNDEKNQLDVRSSETYWLVSWASGSKCCLDMARNSNVKGVLPLGAVASLLSSSDHENYTLSSLASSPYGFYKESHIFCYLPLPVTTKLPVHINGSFAVTPDRRQLATRTKDDKSEFETSWNEAMFQDTLIRAYLLFLRSLKQMNISLDDTEYYNLWPKRSDEASEIETFFCDSFYKELVSDLHQDVFRKGDVCLSFEECLFLDPDLLESEIGTDASEATSFFQNIVQNVLSVPRWILESIQHANSEFDICIKLLSAAKFFLDIFFSNVSHTFWNHETRSRLSVYALDHYFDEVMLKVENVKFIPSLPDGGLKTPKALIHPNSDLKPLFSEDEGHFIHPEYGKLFMTDVRLSLLVKLGLLRDELPGNMLIDRVESIKSLFTECTKCAIERCKHLLEHLNNFHGRIQEDFTEDERLIISIKKTEFLPALPKPKHWNMPWFADTLLQSDRNALCSKHQGQHALKIERGDLYLGNPSQMFSLDCQHLVGSQAPVLNEKLLHNGKFTALLKRIGVRYKHSSMIEIVVDHLSALSENAAKTSEEKETELLLEKECSEIYSFFQKQFEWKETNTEELDQISTLRNFRSIFVNGNFWFPHQVCVYLSCDCRPYLTGLSTSQLRHQTDLCKALNIEISFNARVVIDVLLELKGKYGSNQSIPEDETIIICRLLDLLAKTMVDKELSSNYPSQMDIHVPDEHNKFRPIKDVCFDDVSSIKKTTAYVHEKISRSTAQTIGIKSKTRGTLGQHTKRFRPFGQHEELTSRIKRILSGYQCDIGILKELLQNADDAQATEMRIITDFQTHKMERVFDDSWKPLQGPAVLVYNDSSFSTDDLIGIQQIGIGSKADDPTKTGQFGVGFNAVYHLTDVPSFLTKGKGVEGGETLCVMDPHCKYVPEATPDNPGMQYVDLADLRESFPDVFSVYHENLFPKDKGTIFRFPLRTKDFAENSCFSSERVTEAFINELLECFKKDMPICLLFLNHVTSVSLHSIKNDKMEEIHRVTMNLSKENATKKGKFVTKWKESAVKARKLEQPIDFPVIQSVFKATVSESKGDEHQWIISLRFGHKKDELPVKLSEAFRQGQIELLPRGGVAICESSLLQTSIKRNGDQGTLMEMKAFCTLPLPLSTGLPVHVNGHFALDHEARRNLWMDDKLEFRSEWNIHLIKNVIAPAYIKCVMAWRKDLGFNEQRHVPLKEVRTKLGLYYKSFPLFRSLASDTWRHLVTAFYVETERSAVPMFLSCRNVGKGGAAISCYPIQSNSDFQIVFNTLSNESKDSTQKMKTASQIEKITKDMNMKLIDAPIDILNCLKESDIHVHTITPDYFLDFLKSYKTGKEECCTVIDTSRNIEKTRFKSVDNLKTCLLFCMRSKYFENKVVGAPLCLTEDLMIREFSTTDKVFVSQFAHLFPNSKSEFISEKINDLFEGKNHIFSFLKEVTMSDLSHLLEKNLMNSIGIEKMIFWNPSAEIFPNSKWIDSFWKMVSSTKDMTRESTDGQSELKNISKWCLFPVVHASRKKLYRVQDSADVIDLFSFDGSLKVALKSLNIPFLDRDICKHPLLISAVTSCRKPKKLLDCLRSHRDSIANMDISNEHCVEILAYFSDRINDMKELDASKGREYIRSLPLFVAVHGEHIAVPRQRKVFVLPLGMPSAGIKEWAERTQTTLLSANQRLKRLYEFLEITNSTFAAVYVTHIFQNWHHLPKENRLCHLQFIRDSVLSSKHGEVNQDDLALQRALKDLPFVESTHNDPQNASSFFNNEHSVFRLLCEESEFPPEPFRKKEWNNFMLFAGMKNTLDSALLLQFAKRVQSQYKGNVSEDFETKSRTLMKHLFDSTVLQSESVLLNLKHICFIAPHKVSQTLKDIHLQFEANRLISFSESSLKCHEKLLWSCTPLLPGWATPSTGRGQLKKTLGIKEPSLQAVCEHVKNICTELSKKAIKDGLKDPQAVRKVMEENYEYLTENGLASSSSKNILMTLRDIPLVFLPSKCTFVQCEKIVIGLKKENEISGYLTQSPEVYGAYNDLFLHLGTKRDGDCSVYAKILSSVRNSSKNSRLHPNELKAVASAIEFFFASLPSQNEKLKDTLKDMKLFLPSTKHVLVDASQLVFVNEHILGESLYDSKDQDILIDFKELEIKYQIDENILMRLPDHCRPKLLSQVLEEKIDVIPLQDSPAVDEDLLNKFVQSFEFVNGLLRVISYERKFSATCRELTKEQEKNITTSLQCIHFQEVTSIDTVYYLKGKEISRKRMKGHYICDEKDKGKVHQVLFVKPETSNAKEMSYVIDKSFCKALSESTGEIFAKSAKVLLQILMEYQNQENIRKLLDDIGYPQYCSSTSTETRGISPTLGSLVPDDFHHLLDNRFSVFDEGDYVALLVQDEHEQKFESGEMLQSVYVYAKILERLPLDDDSANIRGIMQKYKVRVRYGQEEIKYAYELYKFSREVYEITSSSELVLYTRDHDGGSGDADQPNVEHSFEENGSGNADQPNSFEGSSSSERLTPGASRESDSRPLQEIFKEVREELKEIWKKVSSPEQRKRISRRLLRKWHPDKNYGNEKKAEEVFKYIRKIIEKLERGESVSDDDTSTHEQPSRPRPSHWFFDDDEFDDIFSGCRRERQRWEQYNSRQRSPGYHARNHSSFYDFFERHRRDEPNPQPYVARQWLRDAKKDLKFAQGSLSVAVDEGTFNWTCYMCNQAVEKALKAAQYNKDAKKVFDGDNLIRNASSLTSEIKTLVQQFVAIVGNTQRMRYPDVVNISRLPCDLYTLTDARCALQHADQIVSTISSTL